jgi:hypothetical protein
VLRSAPVPGRSIVRKHDCGAHAPRVPCSAPSLNTRARGNHPNKADVLSVRVSDEGVADGSRGGCAPIFCPARIAAAGDGRAPSFSRKAATDNSPQFQLRVSAGRETKPRRGDRFVRKRRMTVHVAIVTDRFARTKLQGLEQSKTLRVDVGRRTSRQRLGVRQPSSAFPFAIPDCHGDVVLPWGCQDVRAR